MIKPGDIRPRLDTRNELMVVVLSNSMHLQAQTGRLICCPFVPGRLTDDSLPLVVPVARPAGTMLPELVQWLPAVALGDSIGTATPTETAQAAGIIANLISL